jgi:glucose-1-phosphate cytidylyltransferase
MAPAAELATVILCGGRGMRAHPLTADLPKPLLTVDGTPIVEHVMGIYARRGFTRFVLAAGYMGDRIAAHFYQRALPWDIDVVDTGLDTPTAERIRRCVDRTDGTFFATYADGLAAIDLGALLAAHRAHPGAATVTTVPLPSPYGTIDIDGDGRVRGFVEKPALHDHWINAGFFVMDGELFSRYSGDDLERDILPALAADGGLHAFRHTGFWRSLDTYKDLQELEFLAGGEAAPPWQ